MTPDLKITHIGIYREFLPDVSGFTMDDREKICAVLENRMFSYGKRFFLRIRGAIAGHVVLYL